MTPRVVLRPRPMTDVFDLAFRFCIVLALPLYRRLGLRLLVPGWLVLVTLRFGGGIDWWIVWIVASLWCVLADGAFTIAAGRLMFSADVTVRDVWREWLARLPRYLVALGIGIVVIGLSGVLWFLVFPPIWALIVVAHIPEASLLEHASPRGALRRAYKLSAGPQFAPTIGWLALTVLSVALFIGVFELIGNVAVVSFVLQLGAPAGELRHGGSAFALAGLFCAVPYLATARYLAYVDGRTRVDGWDIQVQGLALVARHGEAVEEDV